MAVKIIKPVTTISGLDSSVEIGGREDPGNILVRNTGTVPVPNFSFMLRVEGIFDLPCKSITGISRENQFDYIQEGGLNDYVHLKRKAISQPFKFQVERYVGVNWVDPLPLGTELVLPVILFVNKRVFPTFQPVRTYTFTGCTVIAKDYGDMNAEASGLLVEKVTIAYREMVCLDIPSETFEGEAWGFDGKKKEGTGDRHYNSNLYNDAWEKTYNSKEEMEKRAKLSKFAKASSERTPLMAKHNDSAKELTAAQMQEKAEKAKWVPKKDTDGTLKPKYGKDYGSMVENYNETIQKQLEEMQELDVRDLEAEKALEATMMSTGGVKKRKYNHSKNATRNGSATYNEGELTKADMEAKAAKYTHSKNATRSGSATYNEGELTKAAMEAKAAKYTHSKNATRNGSATYNEGELTKAAMEAKAGKWVPEKEKNGSLKSKYGRDYASMVDDHNKAIDKEIENASTPEEKQAAEAKKIAVSGASSRKYNHSKNATRSGSATYNEGELTKADMEKKASLYKIAKDKPKDYASAKHHEKELTKTEMEGKAKIYKPSKDTPKGYVSAKHHEKELTKAAMESKSELYKHSKSATRDGAASYNEGELSMTAMAGKAKIWPKESSAHKETMKVPEPRLWPKKKSAKQITDFLKKK